MMLDIVKDVKVIEAVIPPFDRLDVDTPVDAQVDAQVVHKSSILRHKYSYYAQLL